MKKDSESNFLSLEGAKNLIFPGVWIKFDLLLALKKISFIAGSSHA